MGRDLVSLIDHHFLRTLPAWWQKIDEDPNWQEYSFLALAIAYGIIALVAIVQLIRIQQRVPEYGWTTQKVFHLLNAFVSLLRCVVFALHTKVRQKLPTMLQSPSWSRSLEFKFIGQSDIVMLFRWCHFVCGSGFWHCLAFHHTRLWLSSAS